MKKKVEKGSVVRVLYGDIETTGKIVGIHLSNIIVVLLDLNNGLGLREYAVHSSQVFPLKTDTQETNEVEE